MKRIVAFVSIVALMASAVLAAESGDKAKGHKGVAGVEPKKAPAAVEITLIGTISKEAAVPATAGKPASRAKFFITDESGAKIALLIGHHVESEAVAAAAPKVEDFVGQKVKMVVMGHQSDREGVKAVTIAGIKSIEKAEAVPVPAAGAAVK